MRPRTRMMIATGVVVTTVAGVLLWLMLALGERWVILDNANAFPVEVELAGETHRVEPHAFVPVELEPGAYPLQARGPAGVLDETVVVVEERRGFSAVYNLGGAGRYALVTVTYGTSDMFGRLPIEPVGEGTRFFAAPDFTSSIDAAFPSTSDKYGSRTQLCHVHMERNEIGCAYP